jgi:hypothetical protein
MGKEGKMKKWKLWAGMLLIFFIGGAAGAGGTVLFVRQKVVSIINEGQPAAEKMAVRFLSRRLDLSADQKSEAARIAHETQQRLQVIRLRVRPEAIEIIAAGMDELRKLLNPDQQEDFDRLYTTMKRRWEINEGKPATQ